MTEANCITTATAGQDIWVLNQLNHKRNGYFLEIGAYDGIKYSNTYRLEKIYDWTGICVEPIPKIYVNLVRSRNCICENCCVYHSNGTVKFFQRGTKGRSASAIYDEESTEFIKSIMKNPAWLIDSPTMTLLSLLNKHNAPKTIDYFSLDTEGSEYQILKDFDFDTYKFLTLTVEHNCFGKNNDTRQITKRDNIRTLLTKNGYVLCEGKAHNEDWYVYPK